MQQLIDQLEQMLSDNPQYSAHTAIKRALRKARTKLSIEKTQIADSWQSGNAQGWAMTNDDPLGGQVYYENQFTKN